jgi:hypothetical protein
MNQVSYVAFTCVINNSAPIFREGRHPQRPWERADQRLVVRVRVAVGEEREEAAEDDE